MGVQYAELPDWEFTVEELQPGGYRVRAIRNGGITGEASGPAPDTLLDDLKWWATRIEGDRSRST